ncbi:hypothetical protein LUZ60_016904 [Juncus effusus]|nr:hypothetical protein LUZ60_016904 [Juncus effusus]
MELFFLYYFQDMDVLWLRNPFKFLNPKKSEDMMISCGGQTSQSSDNCTSFNNGFFFVNSNNNTISFFDNWYSEMEENNYAKIQGEFSKFDMNVRYLDTKHFSGLCQAKYSVRKIIILHSNCCKVMKSKISDLKSMFEAWLSSNNGRQNVKWPEKRACIDSLKE